MRELPDRPACCASDPQALPGLQLLFVSTLGQARNACALIHQRGYRNALVLVLWTAVNKGLSDRIQGYLGTQPVRYELAMLPKYPTSRLPWVAVRIDRIYRAVLDEKQPAAVWVANRNAHYPLLCDLARARGISVNLFEEGLGTYIPPLPEHEMAIPGAAVPRILAARIGRSLRRHGRQSLLYHLLAAMAHEARNATRLCKSIAMDIISTVFESRPYHALSQRYGGRAIATSGRVWRDFDDVVVVFPERLDEIGIEAKSVEKLDMKASREMPVARLAASLAGEPRIIFVSQPYGDRGKIYYGAVARILAERYQDPIIIKSHPRERQNECELFLRLLSMHGGQWRVLPGVNEVPVEALLEAGHFSEVVGVTSSTLVYAKEFDPDIRVTSIGPELQRLLHDVAETDPRFAALERDLRKIATWI